MNRTKRTRCRLVSAWLGVALFVAAGGVSAQAPVAPGSDEIRALIERGHLPPLRDPDFAAYRSALEAFYSANGYAPQWLGPKAPWRAAIAEFRTASAHGLVPEDYDAEWLQGEFDALARGDRVGERGPRADVALTLSLFRLLSDLDRGRVSPERAGFKFERDEKSIDLPALVRNALATGDVHAAVVAAEPGFPLYKRLEEALARYRSLAANTLPPVPPLPNKVSKIEPGGTYEGTAVIAQRLRLVGDLPADAVIPEGDRYDGALVDAVRAFQDRHGLKADGVLGRDTLAALAVPFATRVRQIELTLERLRWLPDFPPGPLIGVNIPSFRLWAFANGRDDSAAKLTMPVIVGAAVSARETPVFIGEMRYIEFSPYWNVTPTIQRSEVVPKLRRDPGYWEREGFEAVSASGDVVTALDASTIDGLASGKLRVRQKPGKKNALGGVKFVLPNNLNIYLHSTPAQELFAQTRRDFSHGCIRVEDPPTLAAFVLSDQPEWTRERIDAAMNAGKMSTTRLTRPIPVVLFYTTAIVDAKNRALFANDIYGYDAKLEAALRAR